MSSDVASLRLTPASVILGLSPSALSSAEARERCNVTDRDFDDVFRSSYARLVGVLTAATGDADQAADCVQEAFVRAHVRWRKVGDYEDPVGWVRRVAINLARDHARRAARGRRAQDRLAAEGQADLSAFQPADQPLDLLAALAELPPQQRMAMALYYIEGLPVKEVAAEMGVSDGVVKFHLHSGRDRLRRVVGVAKETDR